MMIDVFSVLNLVCSTKKKTQILSKILSKKNQHNCILKSLIYYIKKHVIVNVTNVLNLGGGLLLMKLLSWGYFFVFLKHLKMTSINAVCVRDAESL